MRILPVLFDSQPAYLSAGEATSLLLAPAGAGTVLCAFHGRLPVPAAERVTVIPSFAPRPEYVDAIHAACPHVSTVLPAEHVDELLAHSAPDDWVMVADPLCFPMAAVLEPSLRERLTHSRAALHLVAAVRHPNGSSERVQFDRHGAVRGIRRHYDARNSFSVAGVVCTLLPVVTFAEMRDELAECRSLAEFRTALAAAGVPARDLPIAGHTVDLRVAANLLRVNDSLVVPGPAEPDVAESATVHATVRLVGPVVVQAGVVIGAGATVVGPTVLGAGSRVGAGALVAQCVIGQGVAVPSGAVVRHRAVFDEADAIDAVDDPFGEGTTGGLVLDTPYHALPGPYPAIKQAIDRTVALLSLILLAPVLAIVALAIKLDSRGPVFYGEVRETIGGRLFTCWKFRTMRQGADDEQRLLAARNQMDGPQFKINGDPRITRLGTWLRRVSIDEIPQLFNVLRGDMSLVGPRPSPFRENQVCVPWRQARLSVRAGITGLWQVCRENRAKKGDFHQWIEYDTMYVRHLSFSLDLGIVLATILTLGGAWRVPHTWLIRDDHGTGPAADEVLAPVGRPVRVRATAE